MSGSDSDISLDDPAVPILLNTPDSDESYESDDSDDSERIVHERRMKEAMDIVANLERDNLVLQDMMYYHTMGKIKYKLSEVQGGRSQAYLHHLKLLQEKAKVGQDDIRTYFMMMLDKERLLQTRQILLIGPPNIRRQELRQRLMEDSSCFAAPMPHTSRTCMNHEAEGLDYHFISPGQFELDTLYRKFVEYGEFENAYYGTSLEAIKAVVNSGKICMLKVRSETLDLLRIPDLKPNKVFVALLELGEVETED